ncbi:extracellular solute-binding protein [Desertibaculum subflavum]|uniref:extracellular solute-binding protein n=1 Tax=Desertibaculum subflavum TaxID=2268458 RepID=UPI000E66033B
MLRLAALILLALTAAAQAPLNAQELKRFEALSLVGEPKYKPGFKHLDYVNPDAPKGGDLRLHSIGGFDNLNGFIIKGDPAPGLGFVYQSLMESSLDEMSTAYGAIAASAEVPDDLSYVIYNLRPDARWHDGKPITAEDVVWSFDTLRSKGRPIYRFYYANVGKVEALDPHRVKFTLSGPPNRELPQILGQLTVLPKHWWATRDFESTTLEPPLGSGPYRMAQVDANRSVTLERVKDWWAKDLPINRGRHNFDRIQISMFRDATVALEAFKAHQYDFRLENSAKEWATGYDFPARQAGLVVTEAVPHKRPTGMQAFAFNTRRPLFTDPRVREAISYAFDFEWSNQNLFYGQYTRTESYFSNSEFAARGLPQGAELALLAKYRGKIPEEVFTKPFHAPKTDGSGNNRENLRKAVQLLASAGWKIKNRKLVNASGQALEFELLLVSPLFERIAQPFARNLERLGITMRIRTVDSSQYTERVRTFDFDMVVGNWGQSDSPGNEQRNMWGSAAASRHESQNLAGIRNPVVDEVIEEIVKAHSREELTAATRALDRVLLWNHYVVPQWHVAVDRVAYWNRFEKPKVNPTYGVDLQAWWVAPAKDAEVRAKEEALKR